MNTELINQISRDLNLDQETLLDQGVRSFLKDRKKMMLLERLELLSRNKATSKDELQRKIEDGEIAEHPAWEDLIVVENLDAELKRIDGYLASL
jgi:uncharacterized protein YegJ (DUF2314 family)